MDAVLIFPMIAVVFLLFLSAFFAGSETAMTGCSGARMHSREKEGDRRAALVNRIRSQKENMIGALLTGNTLVNILGSALATSVFIKMFGESGVIYATAIMTVLVLVFGEVLPKTYALHYADNLALKVAPAVNAVIIVLTPLLHFISFFVRKTMKLFGADISIVHVGDHVEVLRGVIEMHKGQEEETQDQRAMLRSVLDLFEVDVEEIMIHRRNVNMIDASQPMEKIVEQVLESPHTRIPVWRGEQDEIIGVIHSKQLLRELQENKDNAAAVSLEKIMTPPWFIPESTTLYDQLQAFRKRREHFALVVDEYGSFMGIVTLEDILEEIVGEIDDEMDVAAKGLRPAAGGSYLIDGGVTIRDLNREYDWSLPDDEDYATVAGLILYEARRIPEVGQSFSFHGFRFDIVKKQRNQITLVRITPPPAPASETRH